MKSREKMDKFIAELQPSAGFTKLVEEDSTYEGKIVKLVNEAEQIRFELYVSATESHYDKVHHGAYWISGHTHFTLADGTWVTFDRLGVDDSFYAGEKPTRDEGLLSDVLEDQLERIKKSRERSKTTRPLPAPLSGFRRSPEEVELLKRQLQQRGRASFHPAGFGVGYNVSVRRNNWAKSAPELAAFLGFPALWVDSFDAD